MNIIKHICEIENPVNVTKAALITKNAKYSDSIVNITCKNKIATADNVMEILSLGMLQGDLCVISASGNDAHETIESIKHIIHHSIT